MNIYLKASKFTFVLLLAILTNCGSDDKETLSVKNDYYVTSDLLLSKKASQQSALVNLFGLGAAADLFVNDYDIYKLEYKTMFIGEEITASGLICVPKGNANFPLLSVQHGTIAANDEAPSVDATVTSNVLYAIVASAGYITMVPDFIGFGSSVDKIHPYYYEQYMASSIVDMIRAGKEFLEVKNINYSNDLFLAGYSEGGYATMVTHKLIESSFPNEFNLIASAPSSGGYDIKHMQEYFFSLETYNQPFYMAYVGMSYQTVLGLDLIPSIFNEPYASKIPDLFDGSKSSGDINAELTNNISELLTADFLNNFDTDAKFESIRSGFINSSPIDWIPKAPMFMYHGTADITVPYQNSVVTYNKLIAAGASTDVVTFTPLEGKTHASGAVPYFVDVILKFEDMK